MANGNGKSWHDEVPSWAKTLAFLAGTLGVPVLVTGYFMAQNSGMIGSPQLRNEERLVSIGRNITDQNTSLTLAIQAMRDAGSRRDVWQEKMLHVMAQTCKNAAKNEVQLRDCDYWRR